MRFLTQPPSCLTPFHSCLETLGHWTKPQEGLSEDPLTKSEQICHTDGSSFNLGGKRRAGYAVVSNFETIVAKPLLPGTSAQLNELIALTRALELGKGKRITIYTDSQVCLSGATCTCGYLERKGPLDHLRVPNQIW